MFFYMTIAVCGIFLYLIKFTCSKHKHFVPVVEIKIHKVYFSKYDILKLTQVDKIHAKELEKGTPCLLTISNQEYTFYLSNINVRLLK